MKPFYNRDGIIIYCGDCRNILPKIGNADLIVTDPPYGVGKNFGGTDTDTLEIAKQLYKDFIPICQQVSTITLTTVGCYDIELFLYRELPPRWRICWRKGITGCPSAVGFTDWEPVFVYGQNVHRNAHDLFTVQPEHNKSINHPTPKPLGFATWLISRFSDEGDLVVDPFLGSGTTLIAAKKLGRRGIGIELNIDYCKLAVTRLKTQASLFNSKRSSRANPIL